MIERSGGAYFNTAVVIDGGHVVVNQVPTGTTGMAIAEINHP